jgi:SAM-dependent methyltransferase
MKELVSKHYDDEYFDWQSSIGEFGGLANQTKIVEFIGGNSDVLDFGCGGGFLLDGLYCRKKVGVEVNKSAAETAKSKGIEVFHGVALCDYNDETTPTQNLVSRAQEAGSCLNNGMASELNQYPTRKWSQKPSAGNFQRNTNGVFSRSMRLAPNLVKRVPY